MTKWSLPRALSRMHREVQEQLDFSRSTVRHPVAKGDTSETAWLNMLRNYLPARYKVEKAFVADSRGNFSDQIDVVIFDRQYSPFVMNFNEQLVLPAESLYAALEAKQQIDATQVKYARQKVASVRKLYRTSLPIPHAGGRFRAKKPNHILGGLLTFDSAWKPPLGASLLKSLEVGDKDGRLDIGCVARHGVFWCKRPNTKYTASTESQAATFFLLELIARLQELATVPMIDVRAYAKWLSEK